MEEFIGLLGERTIGWAVTVMVAAYFLWKVYQRVDQYFSERALAEDSRERALTGKIDSITSALEDMRRTFEENSATTSRYRILRFDDEVRHGVHHSKEHFDQILEDIDTYEKFCETHPRYENSKAVFAIKNIRNTYNRCTTDHTFL